MSTTAARPRQRHVPGEEGIWVLIFGDLAVFGVIFGVQLYYRGQEPDLFRSSQELLNQDFGALNTVLLLVSSLFVVLAVRTVRTAARRRATFFLMGALVCGAGFAVVKVVEYGEKLGAGITPLTNDFFLYYFILTGLHFFHLIIGMGVLLYLLVLSRRDAMTDRQFALFEGGACFWHMVDLLWIVLFPMLYLVH
jgi:nitric oxide reductase NorE protein